MADILIVEDDDYIREMLQHFLENEGHTVVTTANGHSGIQAFRKESFDIVITDLIMPEKEGIETIITLREDDPDAKIIAISGGGLNIPGDYLELASKLGAARTFAKPLHLSVLLEAVDELIEN